MKSFIKKNFLIIVSFLILFIILLFSFFNFRSEKQAFDQTYEENGQFCLENDYMGTDHEDFCLENLNDDNNKIDFFTAFSNVVPHGFRTITFILFLFIAVPCLYSVCNCKNNLTKKEYKKVKNGLFKEAYKSVFIFPIIAIIGIILCYILIGSFSNSFSIEYGTTIWTAETLKRPYLFLTVYLLNIVFLSIIYVNICLCVFRKYHNFWVALILSILCFVGIDVLLEIIVGKVLFNLILGADKSAIFNIMNIFNLNDSGGILPVISFSFIIAIISTIIVFLMYRNKEKLVIDKK